MDELDFSILITLAETGNLTRTAAKLYFAQPTLTKRLKNIEKELWGKLCPGKAEDFCPYQYDRVGHLRG